jgi:methyltransferase FkbM-like protein
MRMRHVFGKVRFILDELRSRTNTYSIADRQRLDRLLMLQGNYASSQVRQKAVIRDVRDLEFRVYSQWGEDGIIDWLVEHVPIDNTTFVEFGVENYQEANTRFLLENRNWRGLIIDGNRSHIESVIEEEFYWRHDVTAVSAFVTRENINDLLVENGFRGDVGLLSIDIDGNDYWVLEAITAIEPRILVCESNGVFGDLHAITIPYSRDFNRLRTHASGQYFGASIKALKSLAGRKGYEFVGSCSHGVNAFFVRADLFDAIAHRIKDRRAFPTRHRDSRDEYGRLTYVRGSKRADLIRHLPVVLVDEDKREVPLESLYPLYSDSWLEDMDSASIPTGSEQQ